MKIIYLRSFFCSLGDTVSSFNQRRESEMNSLKYESVNHTNVTVKPVNNPPLKDITNIKTYEHENSVTMAILSEKLKKGLEVRIFFLHFFKFYLSSCEIDIPWK